MTRAEVLAQLVGPDRDIAVKLVGMISDYSLGFIGSVMPMDERLLLNWERSGLNKFLRFATTGSAGASQIIDVEYHFGYSQNRKIDLDAPDARQTVSDLFEVYYGPEG